MSVTALGPSRGLYVARKGLDAFEVRENEGGSGVVAFDLVVMGKRSALPEHVAIRDNVQFAPAPGTPVAEGQLPGAYRELMLRNGTLNADGSVNEGNAAGRGWRLERSADKTDKSGWTGGNSESASIARD